MIQESFIDSVIERLALRIEKANIYALKKIGESIKKVGTLTPIKARELANILKYGGDYDKIARELARVTEINVKEIYEIFEEVAKKDYEFAKRFYEYRNVKYIPYKNNIALQKQVKALAKITANEYINYSRTLAFAKKINGKVVYTPLSRVYQETIDEAIISVVQGKDTFYNQMYKTIKELGSSGIRVVDYTKNYSRRLDSAVKMNLKGGLRDLHNKIQEIVGEEFGADGVEISVHLNPAQDHQEVQGRQFTKEEFDKFQNNQDSWSYDKKFFSKDYKGHDRRAISEYNCYHYVFSIVLGANKPQYSDEQLQDIIDNNQKGFNYEGKHYTNYEGTQLQRQIETEIRKAKDTQIIARASKDTRLISEMQQQITYLTHKYRDLSKISGLPTRLDRARVSGYHRISVKKSVK